MKKEELIIKNGEINYGGFRIEGTFWLEHSCDEWVIGDLNSAKKFVEDLLKTIKEVETSLTPTNQPTK